MDRLLNFEIDGYIAILMRGYVILVQEPMVDLVKSDSIGEFYYILN